jgi:hypothetical protein
MKENNIIEDIIIKEKFRKYNTISQQKRIINC